jgi:ribosomal protein L32
MATKPNLADCPSCGRFIGPAMSCPYCGADAAGRMPLRVCRWLAVLLGVGGLALLY